MPAITAYSKICKLDVLFDCEGQPVHPETREPYERYFKAHINRHFSEQAVDLENRAVYSYAEEKVFWVCGPHRYGVWREQLAKLAGYPAAPYEEIEGLASSTVMSHQVGAFAVTEGPFRELLCFTDCDGVIGMQVAAKLAGDFIGWDERAKSFADATFYENYAKLRQCFEMAANGGAVSFD